MITIEELLGQLNDPKHLEDPEWLSDAAVQLSTLLYWHNTKTAQAELAENQAVVDLLDSSSLGDKKMSVAEADKRAVVATNNEYHQYKLQGDAVVEAINSVKKKLDQLLWERKNG